VNVHNTSPGLRRAATLALLAHGIARVIPAQMQQVGGTRPIISRDGQWVSYQAARDGNWDIYVARIDGSGERRISDYAEKNFAALGPVSWLGSNILIPRRFNGSTQVAVFTGPGTSGEIVQSVSVPADARAIRPSADGRQIVFLRGAAQHPRLSVATIDGGQVRDLTDATKAVLNPDWSPDGSRIAFTVVDSAGVLGDTTATGTLMTVNADGTGLRRVATLSASDGVPLWAAWSPDGRRIALQSGNYVRPRMEDKTADLWLVDVESGRITKLAPHPARPYLNEAPAWFPDGSRIAFQSNRTGVLQVWTMKPDGTDARQLTGNHP
jgi:Tol biopolymer transport system component